MHRTIRRNRPMGFTLIELLVVIAIIAILAAILFPVFAQAREKARQTACMSNGRQIGTAVRMYITDNDELWPEFANWWEQTGTYSPWFGQDNGYHFWFETIQPYLKNKQVLVCPSGEYYNDGYGAWVNSSTPADPDNKDSDCPGCWRVSWEWNSLTPASTELGYGTSWVYSQQVDPAFNPTHKCGFVALQPNDNPVLDENTNYGPVLDASIEDSAGTIWIFEGMWSDMSNGDMDTDYGWLKAGKPNAGPPDPTQSGHGDRNYLGHRYRGVRGRHFDGFNAVWGDGHMKWVKFGASKPQQWTIQAD